MRRRLGRPVTHGHPFAPPPTPPPPASRLDVMMAAPLAEELDAVGALRSAGDAEELCHSLGIQVDPGSLGLPGLQVLLREHYDAHARRLATDADAAAKTAASYLEDGRLNDALASATASLAQFPWHERLNGLAEAAGAALAEDIDAVALEGLDGPEEGPTSYAAPPPASPAAPPPTYQPDQTELAPAAEFRVKPAEHDTTTEQIADSAMIGAFTAAESGPTENPDSTATPGTPGLNRLASGEFRKAQIEAQDAASFT